MSKYSFLIVFIFFSSCRLFQEEEKKNVVAKVGDEYLYEDELDNFSFENKEDSIQKVQRYIEGWVREQLLLQKALDNLGTDQANIEKQLKNYRNSLLIYAFENQLIKQKLDTVILEKEFQEYYIKNAQNFKLKEDIVSCIFVNYLNSAPKIDSLDYWMFDHQNANWISDYCAQFAMGCHLDTNVWVPFTKIKDLAGYTSENNLYLSNGKNMVSDTIHTLLVNVFEIKRKDEIAPLTYVKEQIRDILLNKRKIQLISNVKQEIFEEATLNERYEIFEK